MPTPPPTDEHAPALRVHLVSHTHWDREWYHSASVFRQRLVPLVDALLDAPQGSFLLDGQCIVLTDYLAMRPDREVLLRRRLRDGSIEVGPWYVLGDNLIPSGEAILRNLEAGARVARRFGATTPAVAWCPDSFGHPAMMPAIASGYGLHVAVVWRGLGGAAHPPVDTLWWQAPDGSRVLTHHLPPDGYECGSALPVVDGEAEARWQRLAQHWRAGASGRVVLLPNGADHHARQRHRDAAVQALARQAARGHAIVVDSSLGDFAAALRESVHVAALTHGAHEPSLPTVLGELRDSYGYTWTLQGTFGTRASQKRTNARLERALLRDVEPWLALAWLHAQPESFAVSPDARMTLAQLPALLQHAWESLLRTHPHDTLCGCSTDDVARAMDSRQRDVAAQLAALRTSSLALALDHDPAAARDGALSTKSWIAVRNRAARARAGLCELTLVHTLEDVPVGPGSASGPPITQLASSRSKDSETSQPPFGALVIQPGRVREAFSRRESPQHYPDNDLVRETRALAWVPTVPAHGVSVLHPDSAQAPAPTHPVSLRTADDEVTLDNGLVQVRASSNGVTISVGDRTLRNALLVESTPDRGDSYTASFRGAPRVLSLVRVAAGAAGPLRASVRLRWCLQSGDGGTHKRDASDGSRGRDTLVDTELVLDANARVVRCHVAGWNRTRDHRLRLVWCTDVRESMVRADAAFGPVRREPIAATAEARRIEQVPATMPLHRWVALSDATRTAALLSDGLAEVEARDDRIAVTLVRAIGDLSRADLPERPGHAGWPCPTPASQSPGPFRAKFALGLFDAWSSATLIDIEQEADDFLLPLVGETLRDYNGAPRQRVGVALLGDGLRASAVTLSRDASALLLRVSNVTDQAVVGAWLLPHEGPWYVTPCRLDETPTGPETVTGARIALEVAPRALFTVCARRAPATHRQ